MYPRFCKKIYGDSITFEKAFLLRETSASGTAAASTLYPSVLDANGYRHSTSDLDKLRSNVDAFTIRSPLADAARGIDGVPFQLNPRYAVTLSDRNKVFLKE